MKEKLLDLNQLSIKDLEKLVGREVADVKVENKYVVCLFSKAGLTDVAVKIRI